MSLDRVFSEIKKDLPWVDHQRLIVGPLTSRELVKDELLKSTETIPSWAVTTLAEFAKEILNGAKQSAEPPLSMVSKVDVLIKVSQTPFLKKMVPELSVHLKQRPVAMKLCYFLTHVDKFYFNDEELDATIEYFKEKNPTVGKFVSVIAELWKSGELSPWGEGDVLRNAIHCLDSELMDLDSKVVWLWAFQEFTPLEELFLEKLAKVVEVRFFIPEKQKDQMGEVCSKIGLEAIPIPTLDKNEVKLWNPHSVWDELEFLYDGLKQAKKDGIDWKDIAVFVPKDDVYKRLVRQKLNEWQVPIHDPTLADGWKDETEWIWCRDFLKAVSSNLKIDDVKTILKADFENQKILQLAYERGIHSGAAQWEKLLNDCENSVVHTLVEASKIFSSVLSVSDLSKEIEKLVGILKEKLGFESEILSEFVHHLKEERPFLAGFKARLSRYVPLFEEYLSARYRENSLRNQEGIQFVAHDVWLPATCQRTFILGTNFLKRARPTYGLWDWEGVEVRRIWEKLHFGLSWEDRVCQQEDFLRHGLLNHENVHFSTVSFDLSGKDWPKGALQQKETTPVAQGGHLAVGWDRVVQVESPKESGEVKRTDHIEKVMPKGYLRVSAFEDYLKCPFLFYARHVLNFENDEESGLEPSPLSRGLLLHKILERYLKAEMQGELIDLDTIVEEEVSKAMRGRGALLGLYRHKALTNKATESLKARARLWLTWEKQNRNAFPELRPLEVEKKLSFDLKLSNGKLLPFQGKVDRIDGDADSFVVVDYKTGGNSLIGRELLEGIGAQLLMYSRGYQEATGKRPAGAYYLNLQRAIKSSNGIFFKEFVGKFYQVNGRNSGFVKKDSFEEVFEKVESFWIEKAEELLAGKFTANPSRPKKDCARCQYRDVCGYKHDG